MAEAGLGALVPVPISEGEDDKSRSPSPSKRRRDVTHVPEQHHEGESADVTLARLLERHAAQQPPWALALSNSLTEQVSKLSESVSGLHTRLTESERKGGEQIANLQEQLDEMREEVRSLQNRGHQRTEPTSAAGSDRAPPLPPRATGPVRRSFGQHAMDQNEVDYNHMVLGGWARDTIRRTIESETWVLLGQMSEIRPDKVVIYGKRASTSHVYLPALPTEEAKARFYELQTKYDKTVACSSGDKIWLSPSRSVERRLRNRATRFAWERISTVCALSAQHLAAPGIDDVDWNRQVIWLGERRVLAPTQALLFLQSDDRHTTVDYRDDSGITTRFFINLSLLQAKTGRPLEIIEPRLHDGGN